MHWLDWVIICLFVVGLMLLAMYMRQYTKSIADFLVANRAAGRYLLTVSGDLACFGGVSYVASFELFYNAGFTGLWWQLLVSPVLVLLSMTGWIAYRYRETRTMTMAEFFEIRYSRNFRVFCGILAWLTGIINMGIFPAVTARFFIYYCGLPQTYELLGMQCSTFVTIMLFEMLMALSFIFMGGMIIVMITDFFQGIFCNIAFMFVLVSLYFVFDWSQIKTTVLSAPENASMINPFKTMDADGFTLNFFLMQTFITIYATRTWQGVQGFNGAAKNAHEAKMSGVIAQLRRYVQYALVMMLPICAYVYLHHTDFAAGAGQVKSAISSIGDATLEKQMTVPLTLGHIFPIGIMGLFAAVMLASAVATDDIYMHSWGSIFIQDIVLPFRKKELSPKQHMWFLRLSILFVAVFVFFFSLLFKQTDFILMYFAVTGALYVGGAGAVIIGGLYWKLGSTAAAWVGMISGGVLAAGGLILQQIWPEIVPVLSQLLPNSTFIAKHAGKFPWNGMEINFFAVLCAIGLYILVSLWDAYVFRRPAFNMEQMLHRGRYAIKGEHAGEVILPPTGIKAILPTAEFTKGDKIIHYSLFAWNFISLAIFLIVTAWHMLWGTTDRWWLGFWYFNIVLNVVLGVVLTIWILLGGMIDLKDFMHTMRTAVHNVKDNGRVLGHIRSGEAETEDLSEIGKLSPGDSDKEKLQ